MGHQAIKFRFDFHSNSSIRDASNSSIKDASNSTKVLRSKVFKSDSKRAAEMTQKELFGSEAESEIRRKTLFRVFKAKNKTIKSLLL